MASTRFPLRAKESVGRISTIRPGDFVLSCATTHLFWSIIAKYGSGWQDLPEAEIGQKDLRDIHAR
jgi:hypothetical protein